MICSSPVPRTLRIPNANSAFSAGGRSSDFRSSGVTEHLTAFGHQTLLVPACPSIPNSDLDGRITALSDGIGRERERTHLQQGEINAYVVKKTHVLLTDGAHNGDGLGR